MIVKISKKVRYFECDNLRLIYVFAAIIEIITKMHQRETCSTGSTCSKSGKGEAVLRQYLLDIGR